MAQAGILTCVLDASAMLALLQDERGGAMVTDYLAAAIMSAVNLHEVYVRMIDKHDYERIDRLQSLLPGIRVKPFDLDAARTAADMRDDTRAHGLSLGDRACLALVRAERLPVLTADRRMAGVRIGIETRLIR